VTATLGTPFVAIKIIAVCAGSTGVSGTFDTKKEVLGPAQLLVFGKVAISRNLFYVMKINSYR
jgi:hypothetical protein